MAYSTRCLKFVVLTFTVVFAVSGVAVLVFSVANLVHFYSHRDFVPTNVSTPVLLLAITGLLSCLVAALGWLGAMSENTCRIYTFSVFLAIVVILEFGTSVWTLTSRANFQDDMTSLMETSFSFYESDEGVVEKWHSLQKELECCGTDGPQDYRKINAVSWSCCSSKSQHEGSCHLTQRGCLTALSFDTRDRLLYVALLGMAASLLQVTGVFCSCCLTNTLKNEERRNRFRNKTAMELKS